MGHGSLSVEYKPIDAQLYIAGAARRRCDLVYRASEDELIVQDLSAIVLSDDFTFFPSIQPHRLLSFRN